LAEAEAAVAEPEASVLGGRLVVAVEVEAAVVLTI
jgi:hypothetical protein